jgi:hypothetical protein
MQMSGKARLVRDNRWRQEESAGYVTRRSSNKEVRSNALNFKYDQRAKAAGENEIKQAPKLTEGILHGSPCEKNSARSVKALADQSNVCVRVANTVTLIQNAILKLVQKQVVVLAQLSIGRDKNSSRLGLDDLADDTTRVVRRSPRALRANVGFESRGGSHSTTY